MTPFSLVPCLCFYEHGAEAAFLASGSLRQPGVRSQNEEHLAPTFCSLLRAFRFLLTPWTILRDPAAAGHAIIFLRFPVTISRVMESIKVCILGFHLLNVVGPNVRRPAFEPLHKGMAADRPSDIGCWREHSIYPGNHVTKEIPGRSKCQVDARLRPDLEVNSAHFQFHEASPPNTSGSVKNFSSLKR
jgi:hypothetical protein